MTAGLETSEWIDWAGGECPVTPGALLNIRFRDGLEHKYYVSAEPLWWRHYGDRYDIIAYRVVLQ